MHQYRYAAYGLDIRSALALPALRAEAGDAPDGDGAADVEIRLERLDGGNGNVRADQLGVRITADEAHFVWGDLARFAVRGGREILVDARPDADVRSVRVGLLGPAFAALLQQRGFLVLHASSVATNGEAVAFLGASGWGKSTLAARLHARGYPLVGDDVLAVRCGDEELTAFAGFPMFKLWPESVLALGGDPDELPAVETDTTKRLQPVTRGFWPRNSLPLRRMYVLARGDDPAVEPLKPREAFLEIASHSYGIHWMHRVSGERDFISRAKLANSVAIRRLVRPWDLSRLDDAIALLEDDLASVS